MRRSPSSPTVRRRAGSHPPLHRAPAGAGGAGAVPRAQVTIGPVIEDGFYYDFAFERPLHARRPGRDREEDGRAGRRRPAGRAQRDAARRGRGFLRGMGENYKVEIIESSRRARRSRLYRQGDFIDLCRGPHVPSTGKLKAFKLTKVAGAYWRGDSQNEMLQRIYGTAWANKQGAEGVPAPHRGGRETRPPPASARSCDLFHTQEEAPGMVFWHPRGWTIYQTIEQYMRGQGARRGYQEIRPRRWWTVACGSAPGTPTSSATTCSR